MDTIDKKITQKSPSIMPKSQAENNQSDKISIKQEISGQSQHFKLPQSNNTNHRRLLTKPVQLLQSIDFNKTYQIMILL